MTQELLSCQQMIRMIHCQVDSQLFQVIIGTREVLRGAFISTWLLILAIQCFFFAEGKVTNDAIESTLAMDHSDMAPTCFNGTDGKQVIYEDACYLHKYDSPRYMIRLACEIFVVIGSFIYMFIALKEMTYVPRNIYFQSLALCPSRCVFLTGCLCTVLMIPCRLACWAKAENNFAIYAATCIPMYFLFFCRGFKSTGPFVTMIYRMMAADLLRFVIIYSIFVMGFSQGFYIVFITYDNV